MLKACSRCGKIHARGECQVKRERFEKPRDTDADRFRSSRLWRRKASEILERDRYCCRMCLKAKVINSRELSVHHIIPIAADYDKRLDNENLITLCRYHHEQAERGRIKRRELLKLAERAPDIVDLTR